MEDKKQLIDYEEYEEHEDEEWDWADYEPENLVVDGGEIVLEGPWIRDQDHKSILRKGVWCTRDDYLGRLRGHTGIRRMDLLGTGRLRFCQSELPNDEEEEP